ncbi:MAG: hypothetical protein QOC92_2747, partial [Acidimicrobiaceae bacterium]
MTKTNSRSRRTLLAALFGAVIALALPGQALAAHDLYIYKAEAQVDLYSDDQVADVGCKTGDHVLDGMWRIDAADQDDDNLGLVNIAHAADVVEAYPSDASTYHFHFVKWAIGRVQAKIFVTCLGAQTAGDMGHTHSFEVSPYQVQTATIGSGNTEIQPDWNGNPMDGYTEPCDKGWLAISPGFRFTSPA